MSNPDESEKYELDLRSSREIVARMDRQIDLVDRILAEGKESRELAIKDTQELALTGFTNSLGMPFVPVPGLDDVQFCIWQTRVQDYAAYAAENTGIDMAWKDVEVEGYQQGHLQGHQQRPDHPVVEVSWEDATAFCEWLSRKEGKTYRLPTDHEWSGAVGIGDREDPATLPKDKGATIEGYPWGNQWPPPSGSGNFAGSEAEGVGWRCIEGYQDPFPFTAPVGSFELNHHGIKDLSGNVWEWCHDWYDEGKTDRVLRGGSWHSFEEDTLRSSCRFLLADRRDDVGFRLVVVGVGG